MSSDVDVGMWIGTKTVSKMMKWHRVSTKTFYSHGLFRLEHSSQSLEQKHNFGTVLCCFYTTRDFDLADLTFYS